MTRALEGHFKAEQLLVLEQARLSYAHYQEQILPVRGADRTADAGD